MRSKDFNLDFTDEALITTINEILLVVLKDDIVYNITDYMIYTLKDKFILSSIQNDFYLKIALKFEWDDYNNN